MYDLYIRFLREVITKGDISTFKSNTAYREILEHCSVKFGIQYYNLLQTRYGLSNETIEAFCTLNDSVGTPIKHKIGSLNTTVSPASLLYLYHAMITLDHLLSVNVQSNDIVEVGCGYGGYIVAIDFASKLRNIAVRNYTCVDLDEPIELQKLYLRRFNISFPVEFHSASTYGKNIYGENLFLVSIYCFSEIEKLHQIGYIKNLFPKISHGIMIWNHVPIFDFGKKPILIETETPCTGPGNKLVLF